MATFQIGETVICSITVKDEDGALQDAATSMTLQIDRLTSNFTNVVAAATAMTNDSTGLYHYDYASAAAIAGDYLVTYTATDGARITIHTDTFTLE